MLDWDMSHFFNLAGAVNFRDLGGLPAADGHRVRRGMVFRSAGLCELTAVDVEALRDRLGLVTIIDLRSDLELERDGVGPLEEVERVHLPLIHDDGRGGSDPARQRGRGLVARYLSYLDMAAANAAKALEVLAGNGVHPALFHCAAGKDRTGVMAALLLHTLEVPDEHIVADYAASHEHREHVIAYLHRRPSYDRLIHRIPEYALDADPSTMRDFLAAMDRDRGGAPRILRDAGLQQRTVDALRSLLLESAGPAEG